MDAMKQGERIMRKQLADATREELLELVVSHGVANGSADWFMEYLVEQRNARRYKQTLEAKFNNAKSLNNAVHMADLEVKIKRLRATVRYMQLQAERHNRIQYATGLIVNCTGCFAGRPDKHGELTEEKVQWVECIARRLRSWWENYKWRKENTK